jgi:hypothetical protein
LNFFEPDSRQLLSLWQIALVTEVTAQSPILISFGIKSRKDILFGDLMKRIAAFLLLFALSIAWSTPVYAQPENRSIGENGREASRAAKQQQKYAKKQAKRQRKAMKKYQKQQKRATKQSQRHGR